MVDESLEAAKERCWREAAEMDAAYERGELDDDAWHAAAAALVVPAYLAAETLEGGSGHSGTAGDWEYSRGIVADAIDRSGTFLDVGCANGLLMESVARWGGAKGLTVEPYGLDISPELAGLAPHVLEIAAQGDPLAQGIADYAARELSQLAICLLPLLDAPPPVGVALTGGLLAQDRPREQGR